jgi:hypothetical protein
MLKKKDLTQRREEERKDLTRRRREKFDAEAQRRREKSYRNEVEFSGVRG